MIRLTKRVFSASQMSLLISLVTVLLSPLVSSLNLPERSHDIAARHNYMMGNLKCGSYYGQPESADCDAVTESVKAFRMGPSGSLASLDESYDEFIQRGADEQYPNVNLHWQLPIYWRTGRYTVQLPSEQSLF